MVPEHFANTVRALAARLPIERFRNPPAQVNVLRLTGVIGRLGPVRGGLTLAGLERAIDRAFATSGLGAVALVINSPGGSPVQSALIAGRIRQLAEEKEVTVIAFAEDVAASGGYWLLTAADEIYADESSIVGSIGVVTSSFGFPALMDRFGVERRVYTSGRRKAMLDPFKAEVPEEVERLKSIQTDIHESFKNQVRQRRGDRLKIPEAELFEGDIWTGRQALEIGLIDGLGDARSVLRKKFGDKVRLRDIPTDRRGLLQRRLGLGRRGGMEAATAEVLAAMEEWAQWKRFGL